MAALDAQKSEREHAYKVAELALKQQADDRAHVMTQRQHAFDLAKAEGEHDLARTTAKMQNDNGQMAAMESLHKAMTTHAAALTKFHEAQAAGKPNSGAAKPHIIMP